MKETRRTIRVISRQSPLALLQVEEAMRLAGISDYEVIKITSYGDKHKEVSLMEQGLAADFFTRELDEALLEGRADIAVHSAKDLPYPLPDGIELVALTESKDKSDSLVARDGLTLATLPSGSKVGTSSAQRKAELLNVRQDIEVVPIRGTIEERIAQVDNGTVDALIVATCALERLGLSDRATERLPFKTHPLQGNLAVTAPLNPPRRGTSQIKETAHQNSLRRGTSGINELTNSQIKEDAHQNSLRRGTSGINELTNSQIKEDAHQNSLPTGEGWGEVDIRKRYGKVWLVGFGPGDPELITVKGLNALREADVVYYDDLSIGKLKDDSSVLNVGTDGEEDNKWIYVGKRSGKHSHCQDEINELLYNAAIEGKKVVRLKGGDPMVFAHGREEIDFLKSRFVEVEVIPGISSGNALASLTQIPLTHRGVARSVAFVLGHAKEIQTPTADTLLYYMGGAKVSEIARALLQSGRSAETPVALVTNVSLPDQRSIFTILGEMKWSVFRATPVLIVVGDVVAFEARAHRTRVYDTSSTSATALIRIEQNHVTLPNIEDYDYVVFTSRYGVRYFFDRFTIPSARTKIISVGSVTTAELRKYGAEPFFESHTQSARGIIHFFRDKPRGSKILLARSDKGLRALLTGLSGHNVTDLPVYTNRPNKEAVRQDLTLYDKILFSSPSGVEAFRELYSLKEGDRLDFNGLIIAKGETTYEAIQTI